ncbi:MAG: hypothetical protein M1839_005267 [Geoglossum umbratile]|nr:MAG: hypothetical protein M1839_005267 [Geoglossum umbratile]
MNKPLGFGDIIVISMDYGTDRQDALALLGSLQDVNFNIIHGVTGAETQDSVIVSGVETALILEDDADWHLNIKQQIGLMSEGFARYGSPLAMGPNTTREGKRPGFVAPYALDWDFFWFGQYTAGPPHPNIQLFYKEELLLHGIDPDNEGKGVRIVAETYGPICTTGYAITRTAAHKLVYNTGYLGPTAPVDLMLTDMVKRGEIDALWVNPALISAWKHGGAMDSDTKFGPEANPARRRGKLT